MNLIPKSIKIEWTKACILIDSAFNLVDATVVEMAEKLLVDRRHEYPIWLKLMVNWKQRNVNLTSEEYFRKNISSCTERELTIVTREIDNLFEGIGEEAFRQALYVIAYQILDGDDDFYDGLAHEWHSRTGGEPLSDDQVRKLFVQILTREVGFWQLDLKPSLRVTEALVIAKFKTPTIDVTNAMRVEASERIREIIKHNSREWKKGNLHNIIKITQEDLNYTNDPKPSLFVLE